MMCEDSHTFPGSRGKAGRVTFEATSPNIVVRVYLMEDGTRCVRRMIRDVFNGHRDCTSHNSGSQERAELIARQLI